MSQGRVGRVGRVGRYVSFCTVPETQPEHGIEHDEWASRDQPMWEMEPGPSAWRTLGLGNPTNPIPMDVAQTIDSLFSVFSSLLEVPFDVIKYDSHLSNVGS